MINVRGKSNITRITLRQQTKMRAHTKQPVNPITTNMEAIDAASLFPIFQHYHAAKLILYGTRFYLDKILKYIY